MIDLARIKTLNNDPIVRDRYVLYWMQASQRSMFNPALEYAIAAANEMKQPLIVGFGLMDDYPEANARHYAFMLQGLKDVSQTLKQRGIKLVVRRGAPSKVALVLAKAASLVVCDRGYLRHQRRWRDEVADGAGKRVVEVEGDAVVPVELTSDKQEFAARTIRPKIAKLVERFLKPVKLEKVLKKSLSMDVEGDLDVSDPVKALAGLKVDRSISLSTLLQGGESEARKHLRQFVAERLNGYTEGRREPSIRGTSMLAAYLHFGQISPLEVALAVRDSSAPLADRDAFLEELIVRRELSLNYVFHQPNYDTYAGLPAWAIRTLNEHRGDKRAYTYRRAELEEARTGDAYWNAAQKEMILTGYMHNMMRMYWGKKILEWKDSPEEAFADALYLNNKYFLCGRDPTSFANVAWLFGLHDRPWGTRPIFGTVRYMNAAGLKRKFDMPAYVKRVDDMERSGVVW